MEITNSDKKPLWPVAPWNWKSPREFFFSPINSPFRIFLCYISLRVDDVTLAGSQIITFYCVFSPPFSPFLLAYLLFYNQIIFTIGAPLCIFSPTISLCQCQSTEVSTLLSESIINQCPTRCLHGGRWSETLSLGFRLSASGESHLFSVFCLTKRGLHPKKKKKKRERARERDTPPRQFTCKALLTVAVLW